MYPVLNIRSFKFVNSQMVFGGKHSRYEVRAFFEDRDTRLIQFSSQRGYKYNGIVRWGY